MTNLVSALSLALVTSGLASTDCLVLLFGVALVNVGQLIATWYGPNFDGAATVGGEPFNLSGLFVARAAPWS